MKRFLYLFLILLFASPFLFTAGRDDRSGYRSELSLLYPGLVKSVGEENMTVEEAKSRLSELREAHHVPYSDESGIIDSFLDQLGAGEINGEKALLYFSYLESKRMSELRQEEGNSSVLLYREELLEKYGAILSELLSGGMTADEAIGEMERFQRNSGFISDGMFLFLQTLLLSYRTGSLSGSQLEDGYDTTRSEWTGAVRSGEVREAAHIQNDKEGFREESDKSRNKGEDGRIASPVSPDGDRRDEPSLPEDFR